MITYLCALSHIFISFFTFFNRYVRIIWKFQMLILGLFCFSVFYRCDYSIRLFCLVFYLCSCSNFYYFPFYFCYITGFKKIFPSPGSCYCPLLSWHKISLFFRQIWVFNSTWFYFYLWVRQFGGIFNLYRWSPCLIFKQNHTVLSTVALLCASISRMTDW